MSFQAKCPNCGEVLGQGKHARKRDMYSGQFVDGEVLVLNVSVEVDPPQVQKEVTHEQ